MILQDELADVRQSAFALMGDLAKSCAPQIASIATQLLQLAMHQLEPAAITQESISACNNACWSLGEPLAFEHSLSTCQMPNHLLV